MLKQAEVITIIKSIPWFLDLSADSLARLSSISDIVTHDAGDILYREGDQHPYFYIVLDGKVGLESYVSGHGPLLFYTAESLDVISCSSMTPVVRLKTSTARVLSPSKLLRFHANDLMECCEKDCELGFIIMRRLANIVASRLLTHRLHLLEIIACQK